MSRTRFSGLDVLLVLVIVAWGANLSVIKVALREFPVQSFNALRLIIAAAAFAGHARGGCAAGERGASSAPTGAASRSSASSAAPSTSCCSWPGVPRTSVANSGLIFGLSPVVISLMSSAVGPRAAAVDALGRRRCCRWSGCTSWSASAPTLSVNSLTGDALVFVGDAVLGGLLGGLAAAARPLFADRAHRLGDDRSPRRSTWSFAVPSLAATDWAGVSWWSWILMAGVVAPLPGPRLCRSGTPACSGSAPPGPSAYSNLTPIAAMVIGWLWLGEPITAGPGGRRRGDPGRRVPDPLVAGRRDPPARHLSPAARRLGRLRPMVRALPACPNSDTVVAERPSDVSRCVRTRHRVICRVTTVVSSRADSLG